MRRADIWINFALGAIGQFPTATQAASAADDLLREFEDRFVTGEYGTGTSDPKWLTRQPHVDRLKLGGR